MNHVIHQENIHRIYKTVLLINKNALVKDDLEEFYIRPLAKLGIKPNEIVSISLAYNKEGKAPVKLQREALETVLKAVKDVKATHLLVCDSNYFKTLTKQRKAEPHHGYIMPCMIEGYEDLRIVLGVNYKGLFHNPNLQEKLDMSLTTLASHIQGTFQELGTNIIHSAHYPTTTRQIDKWLKKLHKCPTLTCDIETRSLKLNKAGIETIAFAWTEHNGIAFCVDRDNSTTVATEIKALLKSFFIAYSGELTYHNASFDILILIEELWVKPINN